MPNPATATARERPLRDWLADLFEDRQERRDARRAVIAQMMRNSDVRKLLAAIFVEARDAGADIEECVEHLREALLDALAGAGATFLDDHLEWKLIPEGEIRDAFEQHDGPYIERAIRRLVSVLVFRRTGRVHTPARLFGNLLTGPRRPGLPGRAEPPDTPLALDEPDEEARPTMVVEVSALEPAAPATGASAGSGAARLKRTVRGDRVATGRAGGEQ